LAVLLFGFRIVYRIITVVICAAIVYLAVSVVQVDLAARGTISLSRVQRAAAIVVTGTPGKSHMSDDYRDKLKTAWSLYSRHLAPILIVGVPSVATSADRLSDSLSKELASVVTPTKVTAVLAKNAGAEFSRVEKRIGRGRRVIVVTDAIDALYMKGVSAADGLNPEVVAPRASKKSVFSQVSPLFRQATAVAVGRVIGFAHATWASD
jgi:hypothetical protein